MTNGKSATVAAASCACRLPGGRSQKSLQLFLIKARMMTEWGMLERSICFSADGKHDGSVLRQDIIRLQKKPPKKTKNPNKKLLIRFRHFATMSDFAAAQGCDRHTRLPMSLKCAATESTFSGKKEIKANALQSARQEKDNYVKFDLERTLITREVATS